MILAAQVIRRMRLVDPFCERTTFEGLSYGLGPASYDVRIAETITLRPGDFALASTIERFTMPPDVAASVKDKSTWARRGLAVQNTFIDPGWSGFLTLELNNLYSWGPHVLRIKAGMPIAQIVFEWLDFPTEQPYRGKYQDQPAGPMEPREGT